MRFLPYTFLPLLLSAVAFGNTPLESNEGEVIDLNLSDICEDLTVRSSELCLENAKLVADRVELKPSRIRYTDPNGKKWQFRISYGFTRTHYYPTDVEIRSTLVNTTIRDFQFDERTSAEYYNPKNWTSFGKALKMFDETSYRITVKAQKGKNVFHFILFHPKALGAMYEKKETVNGQEIVTYTPATVHVSDGTPEMFAAIPEGQAALELQNTHQFITLQLGYGHEFPIIRGKRSKLAYTPSVDAGVTMGSFRSIYLPANGGWVENIEPYGVQGFTVSAGHRLQYQLGRVFAAIEHRFNYGKQENEFLDGTVKYDFKFQTVGFSIGLDLSKRKRR